MPKGVTGKDVIVALSGLFNNDEVLNHAIEFVGSEETMRSLPVDARLTVANMTTEWGALSGLFPIDWTLEGLVDSNYLNETLVPTMPIYSLPNLHLLTYLVGCEAVQQYQQCIHLQKRPMT